MYFSYDLIKNTYIGLFALDPSEGKSRKEKVSGLRYLIATSELLKKGGSSDIDLSLGSPLRADFVTAVGNVVALNEQGLYTQDFSSDLSEQGDYGVGSNFFTTRLRESRFQDMRYPGRYANLLKLEREHISIISNVGEALSNSYGVGNIKAQLCVWLLRNEDFATQTGNVSAVNLLQLINAKLTAKYTADLVASIIPTVHEVQDLVSSIPQPIFVTEKPDYSRVANISTADSSEDLPSARVLENNLPEDDNVYKTVQALLDRGSKGILFAGPPGTSKTWYALKVALKLTKGDESKLDRVQFHPSFTYEDFIEGLVATGSATGTDPMFKPKDKVFLNLCEKARSEPGKQHILIIDEFSRGDPSKIFGELLTYIESDYREIKFRLPYSEKQISIPQNVVIFATMNPYDKSVVDLDSAMERRFDVVELIPSVEILKSLMDQNGIDGDRQGLIINFFNTANRISPHGFGHTYFKNIKQESDLVLLWNHKLKFIFEKMLRFKEDSYNEVRDSYVTIISDPEKDSIL